ncbi:GPI-anchored surface protein, putative [Bodo saltans]|uniref:GPI-anchored surface protein, putative n=1 Tax=Bodo saltans TaxID=75058 RepID=A0A0S4JW30_BODSA|nr:GPI-anchored surface protein, putative [Bodo saltans]|eukprot:CUG93663.1 GPI-anchored surface protein, putative [Bodo saltans]
MVKQYWQPSPSSAQPISTSSPSSTSTSLSLTKALLATSSWVSAVQLILFASSKHIKVQPETLLVAHHRVYQNIPNRPCALAVALLSHLHQHASLPYRLTRTACVEEARKPPVTLFLEQFSYTCQRGHWMDGLRMLQRCAAFPRIVVAPPQTTPGGDGSTTVTSAFREIVSPMATRTFCASSAANAPFTHHAAHWVGVRLLLDSALGAWGNNNNSDATTPVVVSSSSPPSPRRIDVAKELLWLVAYSSSTTELRHPHTALTFFRFVHEILCDRVHCTLADCRELITTSLHAMDRVASAGYPLSTSSACYSFRAAAQRSSFRAIQLAPTTGDAVHVLKLLTSSLSSSSSGAADEEVLLSVFQHHTDVAFEMIRFARDPLHHFISDVVLRKCLASSIAATSSDGTTFRWSADVELVGSQWRYRRATTTSISSNRSSATDNPLTTAAVEMDIASLLPSVERRAEFLLYISSYEAEDSNVCCAAPVAVTLPKLATTTANNRGVVTTREAVVISASDAVRSCVAYHGVAIVKSIPSLLQRCVPPPPPLPEGGVVGLTSDTHANRNSRDTLELLKKLPDHLFEPLCSGIIDAIGEPSSADHRCDDKANLVTSASKAQLASWITQLHKYRGVHPSFLLRFIPRAVDRNTATHSQQNGAVIPNDILVDLLEACVQGPPPPNNQRADNNICGYKSLYEVLIPMALHFLVTIVCVPWVEATHRLKNAAAPWFRDQHYFSALTISPHLLHIKASAKHPTGAASWEIVVRELEHQTKVKRERITGGGGGRDDRELIKNAMPLMSHPRHVDEVVRIVTAATDFWTFQTLMLLVVGNRTSNDLVARVDEEEGSRLPPQQRRCALALDALRHPLADGEAVERVVAFLTVVSDQTKQSAEWAAACREVRERFPSRIPQCLDLTDCLIEPLSPTASFDSAVSSTTGAFNALHAVCAVV